MYEAIETKEPVKIVMLGDTQSGKTCYMLGMYAGASQIAQAFTFTSVDNIEDIRLNNLWSNLVELEGRDRWPQPTSSSQEYRFKFCYAARPLVEFEWLDYRGGAISDISSQEETQELTAKIKQASCLFLCLSAEYLRDIITGTNLAQLKVKIRANLITNLLANLFKSLYVVITVTKTDLLLQNPSGQNTQDPQEKIDQLIANVKMLFPPLFAEGSGWMVMICWTTLGKELAIDPEAGIIEPCNLEQPVIFAIFVKLREEWQRERDHIDKVENEIEDIQRKLFQGKRIKELEKQIESSRRKQEQIAKLIHLLGEQLGHSYIYIDGKEMRISLDELLSYEL